MSGARIATLSSEYRADGLGIGEARPRLAWTIESDAADVVQAEAEIEITRGGHRTTARLRGADQVLVDWPFEPLVSREVVELRVRAELSDGSGTPWSEPIGLEASLLDHSDWEASFVSPSTSAPQEGVRPAWLLRAEFDASSDIARARIYASAHGIYRLTLNGQRVGDDELAPGWTSYEHRLRHQIYDVTDAVRDGANAIGAELSDGWYRGRIGFHGGVWDNYGHDVALLVQLELTYSSGQRVVVPLDDVWRSSPGPVTAASLYDGETYDARLEVDGWDAPAFDDEHWSRPVILERDPNVRLEAPIGPPVRVIESLAPVAVERLDSGRIRLDFGQNISGRLAIAVVGSRGDTVRLHHAEVLEDGALATRPLRSAPSIDAYTLRGGGLEHWEPRLTIHGFRYAELEGWPGDFDPAAVRAQVIHSDMERTGWFASSDPLIDRLHENTVWSMRDNFVDLPTDCPQRDERLGWTGDIQVFAPAATFLYASSGVLASWLRDLSAEQGADGAVPNFVPWVVCGFPEASSAAWGDAAVIVPWVMYERTGDRGVLAEQFGSMCAWVEHLAAMRDSTGAIREGMQLGDWLDPAAPPEDPGAARTDKYFVATAYLVHSSRLTARAAEVLGESELAARYSALAEATAAALRDVWIPDGIVQRESPTALALAIMFDLLEDEAAARIAGERLAALVIDGSYRVQTGFVGTPIICDALSRTGHVHIAYRLLLEQECPSWLYPVTMGATTIWERWDSMLPDGSVNPGEMTSFNHYALGAVVDFLHRTVAGLAPAAPGYRTLSIEPRPGGGLTHASAVLRTPYGTASSAWRIADDELVVDVVVPVGATARVLLPGWESATTVGSGRHRFSAAVAAVAEETRSALTAGPIA